jgi:hypothetical protein
MVQLLGALNRFLPGPVREGEGAEEGDGKARAGRDVLQPGELLERMLTPDAARYNETPR